MAVLRRRQPLRVATVAAPVKRAAGGTSSPDYSSGGPRGASTTSPSTRSPRSDVQSHERNHIPRHRRRLHRGADARLRTGQRVLRQRARAGALEAVGQHARRRSSRPATSPSPSCSPTRSASSSSRTPFRSRCTSTTSRPRAPQLEASGVTFLADTMDSGVCHMAHFKDPDGNTLMLHHRYAPPA